MCVRVQVLVNPHQLLSPGLQITLARSESVIRHHFENGACKLHHGSDAFQGKFMK